MSSTPTDLLVLNGPDTTVFLGYRGTPGLAELDPVLSDKNVTSAELMRGLSWVQSDPVQRLKLQDFLVRNTPAQAMPSASYTLSFNAHGSHGNDPVLAQLHHHLRTGRIRALAVRRHARVERFNRSSRPMVRRRQNGNTAQVSVASQHYIDNGTLKLVNRQIS